MYLDLVLSVLLPLAVIGWWIFVMPRNKGMKEQASEMDEGAASAVDTDDLDTTVDLGDTTHDETASEVPTTKKAKADEPKELRYFYEDVVSYFLT